MGSSFSMKHGAPGWVWPAIITLGALAERFLGGFGVANFAEMSKDSVGFWTGMLTISLAGTLGNQAHKRVVEARLGGAKPEA